VKTFFFDDIRVISIEIDNPADTAFDIIGVDATKINPELWQFCIHCSESDYLLESKWPIKDT
jgi:hypothetical protein